MGLTLFLESVALAASVGLGCGTCCGSGMSAALYGYLMTHAKNVRQSFRAFLDFLLGKAAGAASLCILAAFLGRTIIDENGQLFGVNVHILVDAMMIVLGISLMAGWIKKRQTLRRSCGSCGHCASEKKEEIDIEKQSRFALLCMGFGYGISPCAPLLLMISCAAAMPVGYAAVLGTVFAFASTLSPALLFLLLSGVIAGKMREEIPSYLTWFRLGCYTLLTALFAVSLLKEVLSL